MDWIILAVTVLLLIAYLSLRRTGQISENAAADHLQNGALVIDVRSPGEFAAGHLERAINMPLPQIDSMIGARVTDKNQVLLLHCQSGARSGMARKRLIALGYTQAYNLGSYERAAHIVRAAETVADGESGASS